MRVQSHAGGETEVVELLSEFLVVSGHPELLTAAQVSARFAVLPDRRAGDRRMGLLDRRARRHASRRESLGRRRRDVLTMAELIERAEIERRLAWHRRKRGAA
jgi:hypothetical protein